MKTIETTVYEFSELSKSAKDKAREWYRTGALNYEWWDSMYDDAENIGLKITSFDLDRSRHATGHFLKDASEFARLIVKEHGDKCETHKTATAFLAERNKLVLANAAKIADEETTYPEASEEIDECEAEFLKSILEDYSIMLQKEYEYLLSDKAIDESIEANGYTFTEAGKRYG